MKPIDQTKLLERDGVGDCCRAAVASLLETPLEEVPEFEHITSGQHMAVVSFVESLGYEYHGCLKFDGTNKEALKRQGPGIGGHFYAAGQSPRRQEIHHAVVIDQEGNIAHDPHPSRDGVVGPMVVLLFKPLGKQEEKCLSNATKQH